MTIPDRGCLLWVGLVLIAGCSADAPRSEGEQRERILLNAGRGQGTVETATTIASSPACVDCVIDLDPVATIGEHADSLQLLPTSRLVWTPWGRFYAAPVSEPGVISVYDSAGRSVGAFGRAGSGPGEIGDIDFIAPLAADRLAAKDMSQRLVIFSRDGSHITGATLPAGVASSRLVALSDNRLLVNNRIPGSARLLLVDTALSLIREFGQPLQQEVRDGDALQMVMAEGDSGTFAAVQFFYEYLVELWDTSGVLIKRLARRADWYPPYDLAERLSRGPLAPPLPRITSVYYADGLLWVTGLVPDEHWQPPRGDQPQERETRGSRRPRTARITLHDMPVYYDTMLEVLDLRRERLLVGARMNDVAIFIGGGLLAAPEEGEDGHVRFVVRRPRIQRRG